MTPTFVRRGKRWLYAFLFSLLTGPGLLRDGQAQTQNLANPTDLHHPWISGINPAVIPFQNSQLAVGLKILHWGFLESQLLGLRENGFTISFPFLLPYQVGFGFEIRQFYASVYSELAGSALVSKEIYNRLAIGVKFGLEQRSLDKGKFHLVDQNDPLLQSKLLDQYKLNAGAGLYWNPGNFTAGIGVDHLNRANVARQGKFLLPREISGAVSHRFGPVAPSVIVHNDGAKWNVGFAVSAVNPKLGTLRLGYENSFPLKLEAEFNLTRNSKLNYAYDFATEGTRQASIGSQQLTYSYIFGREPEIGEPMIFSSTNNLNILAETITRSTTPKLAPQTLAAVADLTPDYVIPMASTTNGAIIITAGKLGEGESASGTQNRYHELAAEIERILRTNADAQIVLRAPEGATSDAEALKRFLTERLRLSDSDITLDNFHAAGGLALEDFKPGYKTISRKELKLSSERVVFDLKVPGKTRRTKDWTFTITRPGGQVVRSFSGKGNLPYSLEWDWRGASGKLVSPGIYHCRLQVRTKSGKVKAPPSGIDLEVFLTRRNVTLKFYEKPKPSVAENTSERVGAPELNKRNIVKR